MKRIGLFIDTWYPMVDGVVKVVDNYARRLVNYCDVVVFCPKIRGYNEEEDAAFPYKIVRCQSLPFKRSDYEIPASVLDPRFDVQLVSSGIDFVHIHSPFSIGLAGALFAKVQKIPLVATLHSQYKQDFENQRLGKLKPVLNLAMSGIMRVFNLCNECWAVNESMRELYVNEYGLKAPCKVRLNASEHRPVADAEAAAREIDAIYGIRTDDTVFLFVGRINYIKNLDFIVRSLAIAKARGLKQFRMLFVGKDQDEEKLMSLIKENNLTEEVMMCGPVNEIQILEKLYSRAKLFLFPSLYDANSLVQIEAACQGTPTVFLEGSRTACMITHGINGYLSAPDEEHYARLIIDILADEAKYRLVSENARKTLYINWDKIVLEAYSDYMALCEKR